MQHEFNLGCPSISNSSPLMYPGGKTRFWPIFKQHLPDNTTEMISPFIGGGSIELNCAARGIKVTAFDLFEPLVNFWQYFIEDSTKLIDFMLTIFPLSYEQKKYYHEIELKPNQKDYIGKIYSDFERAALFLCMNKQSFRGFTLSQSQTKGYSKGSANPTLFKKFRNWKNPNITVNQSDYKSVLDQYEGKFMYLDPPYVDKEHYYGLQKNRNEFDHYFFQNRISNLKNKWILSYAKHDLILDLYKDFNIFQCSWAYTIQKNMEPNSELLITNF